MKLKWRVMIIALWLFVIAVQLFEIATTKEGASSLRVITVAAASIVILVSVIRDAILPRFAKNSSKLISQAGCARSLSPKVDAKTPRGRNQSESSCRVGSTNSFAT